MPKKTQPAMFGLGLLVLAGATPAGAQPVDYQAMEDLFGEPVTTSVTGKPQRASDAPANIEIITQDDIRRSGATTIPDALRFVTGVDVRNVGIASADVGIRGYNQTSNPHLMVLIDGRQIYMVDYGRVLWAALPVQLDEIRQIEIIKGPNSALYGFNAVGGVINIITYDPLKERINAATLRGGTQGYGSISAVGTGKIGETAGLRLSAGGFQSRDYAPGPLGLPDQLTRQSPFAGSFNADGRWQVTPQIEAFLDGSYGTARLSQPSIVGIFDTEQLHHYSVRGGVMAETPIGVLSLSAYRNQINLNAFGLMLPGFTRFTLQERQSITLVQANDLVKVGADHTLRFGLEYRQNAVDAGFNGKLSDTIYAGSIMWDWQITPSLTATNAIRIDHVEVKFAGAQFPYAGQVPGNFTPARITEPSVNSGLVWKASDLDTFRLTLARGVQLPTLLEQGLQINVGQVGPVAFFGKPSLVPSITWSTEFDYDRAVPEINSVLRTALFVQRTDNVITTPPGGPVTFVPPGFPVLVAANVGYTTAAGLELGIRGHAPSGWRWNASYALAETTNHTSLNQGRVVNSTALYARSVPSHVVLLGIGYSIDRWEADLMARWQSSFMDVRAGFGLGSMQLVTVNNYLTVNARVGFQLTDNLTLAAVAQQLNESRLLTTGAAPMERRLVASLTARF